MGYVTPESFFLTLQKNLMVQMSCKFITLCLELEEKGKFEIEGNCSNNHFGLAGAGTPTTAVEVRNDLFKYFIDVCTAQKGQLPTRLFLGKSKEIFIPIMKKNVKREMSLRSSSFEIGGLKAGAKSSMF